MSALASRPTVISSAGAWPARVASWGAWGVWAACTCCWGRGSVGSVVSVVSVGTVTARGTPSAVFSSAVTAPVRIARRSRFAPALAVASPGPARHARGRRGVSAPPKRKSSTPDDRGGRGVGGRAGGGSPTPSVPRHSPAPAAEPRQRGRRAVPNGDPKKEKGDIGVQRAKPKGINTKCYQKWPWPLQKSSGPESENSEVNALRVPNGGPKKKRGIPDFQERNHRDAIPNSIEIQFWASGRKYFSGSGSQNSEVNF